MKFWIKYTLSGLAIALFYLLFFSESEQSLALRQWLAQRFVYSVQEPVKEPAPIALPTVSYADAIAKTAPSVVSIQTVGQGQLVRNPYPKNIDDQFIVNVGINVGSGVIINDRGYVVTNYHVVRNAKSISVQLSDGRKKIATLVGSNKDLDLAVLHIDLPSLPTALINTSRKIQTGDVVFAIGNPYGEFDQTVTMGIVGATRAFIKEGIEYLLQVDAAIHPGNSGGALINAYGELIGITNMQLTPKTGGGAQTGISFILPYSEIEKKISAIINSENAWLGMTASTISPNEFSRYAPEFIEPGMGFKISGIAPEGPAALAGLQENDFVSHINNRPVKSFEAMYDFISDAKPGDKIALTIYRNRQEKHEVLLTVEKKKVAAE
ncbi:S1C family serine protease [Pleionea sp. CnH1-48]|uniref:S1C family serine protease n=1 Tax=Pleionea sp. CnH1-48 TaxID=2954494 RepID=UPI002098544B|nr:trypsin-like peptidase domain-containing protein [Pleionea sp. CnH1-48]MCO7224024.1 trypsin-like peptidase domain-containing protein [Pleionea sp. CnH1-48]